jgi:hypothetical protein
MATKKSENPESFIDRFIWYFGRDAVADRLDIPTLMKALQKKHTDSIRYTYSVDWHNFPYGTNPHYDVKKLEEALELLKKADVLIDEAGIYNPAAYEKKLYKEWNERSR